MIGPCKRANRCPEWGMDGLRQGQTHIQQLRRHQLLFQPNTTTPFTSSLLCHTVKSPGEIFGLTPANSCPSFFTWSGSPVRTRDQRQGHWHGLNPAEAHHLNPARTLSRQYCQVSARGSPGRGWAWHIYIICIASCRWQQWNRESVPAPQQHKRWGPLSCMEMIMNESHRHGDGKSRLFGQRYSTAPKRHAKTFWGGGNRGL